jgi:hypothetical protein
VPTEAGDFELHAWCDPDGSSEHRLFFPGCPFTLHVAPGHASAVGSYLRDGNILSQVAGERLVLRVQLRDEYGNHTDLGAPDEADGQSKLLATLDTPSGPVPLALRTQGSSAPTHTHAAQPQPPALAASSSDHAGEAATQSAVVARKGRNVEGAGAEGRRKAASTTAHATSAVGAYEVVSPTDLTLKGAHEVSISLDGVPVHGSPMRFVVVPGAPVAAKSWLQLLGNAPPSTTVPLEVKLQLVDRYGNDVEKGDVRVDAKVPYDDRTSLLTIPWRRARR